MLLAQAFGRDDVAGIRHAVAARAASAGLDGQRLDDFVLAVNEITTNAVRHARGRARVLMWTTDGLLRCEVTDSGDGIPPDWSEPHKPPTDMVPGGRGLWIARQLCDELTVRTGPDGTAVRLTVALDSDGPGERRPPAHPAGDQHLSSA